MKISVALVGAGYWGKKLLPKFRAAPDCSVAAVCDLDAGLRQDIAHHQSVQRSFSTTSALVARINAATQSLTAILSIPLSSANYRMSGRIRESVSA